MNSNKKIKKNLICLKTGSKATIINSYFENNTAYVKINILMKFQDTFFQVTKTLEEDDVQSQFTFS
jgi:hypothetical protein